MAKLIKFNDLLASYRFSILRLIIVKHLAWYGLASGIRIDSFKSFCMLRQCLSWPATAYMLEKWMAYQIYDSTGSKKGQVKPEIMFKYFFALKFYHVDYHLRLKTFDTPRIALIIKSGKRLFPKQKAKHLPINKKYLRKNYGR